MSTNSFSLMELLMTSMAVSTSMPREPDVTSPHETDPAVDIMLAELDLLEELAADELKLAPGAARRQWAGQQLSLKG